MFSRRISGHFAIFYHSSCSSLGYFQILFPKKMDQEYRHLPLPPMGTLQPTTNLNISRSLRFPTDRSFYSHFVVLAAQFFGFRQVFTESEGVLTLASNQKSLCDCEELILQASQRRLASHYKL